MIAAPIAATAISREVVLFCTQFEIGLHFGRGWSLPKDPDRCW